MSYNHLWDNTIGRCRRCGVRSSESPGPCADPLPTTPASGSAPDAVREALVAAREWLDYENSPMGVAETKAYERLIARIDAALATPAAQPARTVDRGAVARLQAMCDANDIGAAEAYGAFRFPISTMLADVRVALAEASGEDAAEQAGAALEPMPECPYNHPVGTRCPSCSNWPYSKGGGPAYAAAIRAASPHGGGE